MKRGNGKTMRIERAVAAVAAAYLIVVQLVLLGVSTGVAAAHQLDGTAVLCNGVASNATGGLPAQSPGAKELCCIVFGGLPADTSEPPPTVEAPTLAVLDQLVAPLASQRHPDTRAAAHGARAPPAPRLS